jgi:hypothetical protein
MKFFSLIFDVAFQNKTRGNTRTNKKTPGLRPKVKPGSLFHPPASWGMNSIFASFFIFN